MDEAQVSSPPMPMFNRIQRNRSNTMVAPLPIGGKRRKKTRKYKKHKITRKIYRGGQALPKPTLSFLRSFIDPKAVNKVFNNTAIIRINYPTQIVDNLYKLDARLFNPNGNNIASTKIKNFNNIRELTVSELQASVKYQLTVKLVNKATNKKSVDSNTLTIEILIAPIPAPRPAPNPSPIPSPNPNPASIPAPQPAQSLPLTTTGVITTVAGTSVGGFNGDGRPGTSASLYFPTGVAVDHSGNLFIADSSNNKIRRLAADTGIITTVAGNGWRGFSGDGGPAISAKLNGPMGVAVDGSGNLFIADTENTRIRKVDAGTGIITTVAGDGKLIFFQDKGPATSVSLHFPYGVVVDSSGNLFISDPHLNRIQLLDATMGIITTVAGNRVQGFSGDGGPATSARLSFPMGLAVDGGGNVLIADTGNNRVRRLAADTGIITTVAGNGTAVFSGDGGPATNASFAKPSGVVVDSGGNLFIADSSNNRIRRIAADTGIITTVAGNGIFGFSGDGGLATSASFAYPKGIALDANGNLFIVDRSNSRIRKVNGPIV